MKLIVFVNGETTESPLPTSFMNYTIHYETIDPYSCVTVTTTVIPDETSTVCLTTTEAAVTTQSTITTTTTTTTTITSTATVVRTPKAISLALTAMPSTSKTSFVAPTCATQSIGLSCNMSSDPCAMAQPCYNLATCFPNNSVPEGYTCACQSGFSGMNCEVDNRGCRPGVSCLNGGTCNETSNDTTCKCSTGKTGDHCQYEIYICANVNCQNDALCTSSYGNWLCLCTNTELYSGTYCEIKSTSLKVKEIVSRSFGCVAIGCISVCVGFFITMDILKYFFNADPSDYEVNSWQQRKQHYRDEQKRRRREEKQRKINSLQHPVLALRFNYIHA